MDDPEACPRKTPRVRGRRIYLPVNALKYKLCNNAPNDERNIYCRAGGLTKSEVSSVRNLLVSSKEEKQEG